MRCALWYNKRMDTFKRLFGIPSTQVRRHCILLPVVTPLIAKGCAAPGMRRGMLYAAVSQEDRTFIHCGIGAALAGDAVLYLEKTGCRDIVLFGSCGLVRPARGLGLASMVSPAAAFAWESFSGLLAGDTGEVRVYKPDVQALQRVCAQADATPAPERVICATVGSLLLERGLQEPFAGRGIDVVDMECSAVFAAAAHIRRQAAALFFVSDLIAGQEYTQSFSPDQRSALARAVSACGRRLDLFCRQR